MPEVKEILEWHTSPPNRTIEALAVIGAHIPTVYWIDRDWLSRYADPMFHLSGLEEMPRDSTGWAAWNAFLIWVRPHAEYFRLFQQQFEYAVSQSGKAQLSERGREKPMYNLGQHLVVLFGWGILGEEAERTLLFHFLQLAHPQIRRQVIGFVGQWLGGDAEIPEAVLRRFMKLWDGYWRSLGIEDARENPDAPTFGMWFTNGRFPNDWAITTLSEYVKVNPTPEPDDLIVERLATIAATDIDRSIDILDQMTRGDEEGWRTSGWLESATSILTEALKRGGAVNAKATALINYLGRRGHSEIGALLRPTP